MVTTLSTQVTPNVILDARDIKMELVYGVEYGVYGNGECEVESVVVVSEDLKIWRV